MHVNKATVHAGTESVAVLRVRASLTTCCDEPDRGEAKLAHERAKVPRVHKSG